MRARHLAALGLIAVLAACAGKPLEELIEQHPANVLPQHATQVFAARVDRLRQDPLVVLAYEASRGIPLGAALKGTSQTLQLAGGDIAWVALGVYGTGGGEAADVLVATGKFDDGAFRQALDSGRVPYVEGRYGDCRYYTCGRGEARSYVAIPSGRLLVAASREDLLKRTLDLRKRGGKSVGRDPGFAPLLKDFSPGADFWGTGGVPTSLLATRDPQLQGSIQGIQAFSISLAGTEDRQWELVLHCGSPEASEGGAVLLRNLLSQSLEQIVGAGYDVRDLRAAVARSKIVVDGPNVTFKLVLSKNEVEATARALRAQPVAPQLEPGSLFGPPGAVLPR